MAAGGENRWPYLGRNRWPLTYRALLIRWSKKSANHDALLQFSFALITWQQMGVMPLLR